MAKQIVTHKRDRQKLIDWIPVDNGQFFDSSEFQLNLPTKLKDGLYPVYLSADGCRITIDITPFADGFIPAEESHMALLREVVKMRRRKTEAERLAQ